MPKLIKKHVKLPEHIHSRLNEGKQMLWCRNTNATTPKTNTFLLTNKIISGSCDKTIKIWDAQSGACLQTLTGHEHWIECLLYLPLTHQIVSGSCDWTIKIWCIRTGACMRTLVGHNSWINSLLHITQSNELASGSWDNTIKIWSLDTGECKRTLLGHRKGITCLLFLDDNCEETDNDDENKWRG
jgi:WD40 repeat protein